MAERKDRMALLSRYSKFHTARYEKKANLNLNVEQWASDALIDSYGIAKCYELLEYYFTHSLSPSWNYFAYNCEKILQAKLDKIHDDEARLERRKKAKEWLSE